MLLALPEKYNHSEVPAPQVDAGLMTKSTDGNCLRTQGRALSSIDVRQLAQELRRLRERASVRLMSRQRQAPSGLLLFTA
jgi:hypothetical protein